MEIYEKLDFIMNLLKVSNSALSLRITLDASHISRLRRGERRLVPDAEYVKDMACFFASRCTEQYQTTALAGAMDQPEDLFKAPAAAAEAIRRWLAEETGSGPIGNGSFPDNQQLDRGEDGDGEAFFSYGTEGKREAVLGFLSSVVEAPGKGELLLHSDEAMDWLTQDRAFQAKWGQLLLKAISQGRRIRIIHTVSRDLDDMLEALSKWIPLYLTGAIEPYYYPRKRDGIFRRTLFIAPGCAAVSGHSLDAAASGSMNLLVKDSRAVKALEEEFRAYLNLCRPLMAIYGDKDRDAYLKALGDFDEAAGEAVIMTDGLPIATMPEDTARSMLARADVPDREVLLERILLRKKSFLASAAHHDCTEIIRLGEAGEAREGILNAALGGISGLSGLAYTREEYREHLLATADMLRSVPRFHIAVNRVRQHSGFRLYVKEHLGAMVEKTTQPHIAFAMDEGNMTAALWDYLQIYYGQARQDREGTIRELAALAEALI